MLCALSAVGLFGLRALWKHRKPAPGAAERRRRNRAVLATVQQMGAQVQRAATLAEIDAIAKSGIGASYLDKVKQLYVRERETSLRTNHTWVDWLARAARSMKHFR